MDVKVLIKISLYSLITLSMIILQRDPRKDYLPQVSPCVSLHSFLFSETASQKHCSVIQAKGFSWAGCYLHWSGMLSKKVKALYPSDSFLQCFSSFVRWVTIWNYCQVPCLLLSWVNILSIPKTGSQGSVYRWYLRSMKSCRLWLCAIPRGENVLKMDFFF